MMDVDEAPDIMSGDLAIAGPGARDYAENGAGMVASYTALGPDAGSARWSMSEDDAGDFRLVGKVPWHVVHGMNVAVMSLPNGGLTYRNGDYLRYTTGPAALASRTTTCRVPETACSSVTSRPLRRSTRTWGL